MAKTNKNVAAATVEIAGSVPESVSPPEPVASTKRVPASAARKLESLMAHLEETGTGKRKLEAIRALVDVNPDASIQEFVAGLYDTAIAPGTIEKCRNYCIDIGLGDPKPRKLAPVAPPPPATAAPGPLNQNDPPTRNPFSL